MTEAHRTLKLATASAVLALATALAEPASAQGDACKTEAFTASGRAKFRPFTKTKELDGKGSAMADAVANWQREVSDRYGDHWKAWSRARDTTFDCAPTKSGKIIGSSFIGCTISGRPCSGAAAAAVTTSKAGDGGQGKRSRQGERIEPPQQYDQGDPAYRREMERQQQMAAQRSKAEADAYAREMALQDRLTQDRNRGEYRGRSNSR